MPTALSLPVISSERAARPNTTELLPLEQYDLFIISYSGGKDSLAALLDLLERGVPKKKIVLWHQHVDGAPGSQRFMDWPVTESYCRATSKALGIPLSFQWKVGGFEGEMLRRRRLTKPTKFELPNGKIAQAGGKRGKRSTRRKFPQVSADLSVRWCSSYLKIDVAGIALRNIPDYTHYKICFVTGERREESAARARYAEFEKHRANSPTRRVDQWRSIIDWSEQQVWDIIKRWHINPHPAYRLGWGRVSCMCCIFGDKDQWASVRRIAPNRFRKIARHEKQFGCTIQRKASVVQQADNGTPFPQIADAKLVKLALGHTYPIDQFFTDLWELPAGAYKRGGGPV